MSSVSFQFHWHNICFRLILDKFCNIFNQNVLFLHSTNCSSIESYYWAYKLVSYLKSDFMPHEKCIYFWTRNKKIKSVIESHFDKNLSSTLLGILHWWNTIKLIAIDSTEKEIASQFFSPFLFSFTIFDLFTLYNFLHHFHNKSGC